MTEIKLFLCLDTDKHIGTFKGADPSTVYYDAYCALCQATEKDPPAYCRIDDREGVNQCMSTNDAIKYLEERS